MLESYLNSVEEGLWNMALCHELLKKMKSLMYCPLNLLFLLYSNVSHILQDVDGVSDNVGPE